MGQLDRQNEILELVRLGKCTSVKELCSYIYASPATIRRDLRALECKGFVRLAYGNVILLTDNHRELPLAFRESQARESKRAIAHHAASLITANSSVILDASSTAMNIAEFIAPDLEVTVFTNCIKTAVKLCENGIEVYMIGGRVDGKNYVTRGTWTMENLSSVHADYLFFSSQALDHRGVISGQSEDGVQMRKYMLSHADKQYFLCNADKVGNKSTFTLCHTSDITGVITDADISHIPNTATINIHAHP